MIQEIATRLLAAAVGAGFQFLVSKIFRKKRQQRERCTHLRETMWAYLDEEHPKLRGKVKGIWVDAHTGELSFECKGACNYREKYEGLKQMVGSGGIAVAVVLVILTGTVIWAVA